MPKRGWKDIAARLQSMPAAEISSRLQQAFDQRADLLRSQLGFRFHEEPSVSIPAPSFFFEASQIDDILQIMRARLPRQVAAIIEQAERICAHRFDLLGYSALDYGHNIDWHLDAVNHVRSPRKPFFRIDYLNPAIVGDPKVTWELSRHQHLVTLAKAYCLTSSRKYADECFKQWYSWQQQNPYPIGIHWSSSLEVGFRSLSWCWISFLLTGCDVMPQSFPQDLLRALSINGRYIQRFLSTYTSPNTHLLGEAVALFFLGTLYPQLPSARSWQQTGWRIILEEASHQVRSDGFHFEQSTYYHVYALDFFLHARMLAARNSIEIPPSFDRTLVKMLDVLRLLNQTGAPPSFGDDDGGRVFDATRNHRKNLCDPLSTGAVLFHHGDFKSACPTLREEILWLLGPEAAKNFDDIPPVTHTSNSSALADSGIYIMLGALDPPTQLVIDAGPQGTHNAGHGHADALAIHLSAGGKELLSDPGTFEYGGSGEGRRWFRSTPAHNTLSVDGFDQAEPNGPFAWSALPHTKVERWHVAHNFDVFHASHTGYERLNPPVTHERWIVNFKTIGWLVRDVALGSGSHTLDLAWHQAPNLSQLPEKNLVAANGMDLSFIPCRQTQWPQEVMNENWSPAYGLKVPSKTIHQRFTGPLPAESATFLQTVDRNLRPDESALQSEHLAEPSVHAYCFSQGQQRCGSLFAPSGGPWSFLGWSTDADLLCYRSNGDHLISLLLCNASFVDWKNKRLWSSAHQVPCCELTSENENEEMAVKFVSTR